MMTRLASTGLEPMRHSITLETLRILADAGSLREVLIVREGECFAVRVRWGAQERPLASKRQPVRLFRSIDSACRLLASVGLKVATVDLS